MRIACGVLLLVLCLAAPCRASFTVEWGYTPPSSPAVTGYRLYRSGIRVIDFPGAATKEGVVNEPVALGDVFTLTALFADGTESPHSAPFIFRGTGPVIQRIDITPAK